jgi:pimeloyl-ACP methyl ester carboxylesterase
MSSTLFDRQFVTKDSPTGFPTTAFGAHPLQGVYVTPGGKRPTTAFIATHVNLDFTEHYLGPLLAERGYGFLGWNTRFRGMEQHFLLDHAVAEIGAGVKWLREEAGVERVVLIGNSGGGALMAAYQAQSLEPHLRPAPKTPPCEAAQDLIPGDLYISVASHPGRPDLNIAFIDPSVVDEADPLSVDPELDMYDARNSAPYSQEFQTRYRAAQLDRNRKISAWARTELDRLSTPSIPAFDRLFTVPRLWADLRFVDGAIEPSDRNTPECWIGDPKWANYSTFALGCVSTLRTWLSMWSIDDSQFRIQVQGPKITTPALVIDASGDTGVFTSDTDLIFNSLASTDKTRHTIKADHYFADRPDARTELTDLIDAWVDSHTSGTR